MQLAWKRWAHGKVHSSSSFRMGSKHTSHSPKALAGSGAEEAGGAELELGTKAGALALILPLEVAAAPARRVAVVARDI